MAPEMRCEIVEVVAADTRFDGVVELATTILNQGRYLLQQPDDTQESHIVAAFAENRCVGFLRFAVQIIGADVGRPPVLRDGVALREGYVEAFGVDPEWRRQEIGTHLQAYAADYCRQSGCYQMRSRSPVTSTENYALKINAGYVLHPSEENDSYYFLRRL